MIILLIKIKETPSTKSQIPGPDRLMPTVFIIAAVSLKRMMIYIYDQVAPGRAQTNPNDQNSKFETSKTAIKQ